MKTRKPIQKIILYREKKDEWAIRGTYGGKTFGMNIDNHNLPSLLNKAILATKNSLIIFRKYGNSILKDNGRREGDIDRDKLNLIKFNYDSKKEIKKIKWVVIFDEVMGVK